eukprot:575328-Amphidinium_carterae.1
MKLLSWRGERLPAEDDTTVLVKPGMRVRLTQNLDKGRGFVNGNSGVVEHVLRPDVFIVKTMQDVRLLVHPVCMNGSKFIPITYGYATTMRRAQGATLHLVGLHFDRRLPDRGYAYVGTSRAKYRDDVYLVGSVRSTDWLPVGGNNRGGEQSIVSALSESTHSSEDGPSTSDMSCSDEASEDDFDRALQEQASSNDPSEADFGRMWLEGPFNDPSEVDSVSP